MTQRGFDLADAWNSEPESSSKDTHYALLSESLISNAAQAGADRGQQRADAPAQPAEAGKKPPESEATKQLQAAMDEYEQADDKQAAIKTLGPKFEAAIKTADEAFGKARQEVVAKQKELAVPYAKAMRDVQINHGKLQAAFNNVPEGEQEKVQALLAAYPLLDPGDPIRKSIEEGLKGYPGLVESARGFDAALKSPVIKQVEQLQKSIENTTTDTVMTRMGYAEALNDAGFEDKAMQYLEEAAAIMGLKLPKEMKPKSNIMKVNLQA